MRMRNVTSRECHYKRAPHFCTTKTKNSANQMQKDKSKENPMPEQSTSTMIVSYPATRLVDNLQDGASQDIRKRRISLERISTKQEKRRQSLPVLPSYLILAPPKKSSLKKRRANRESKGVTFPLGVLMQQAVAEGDLQGIKQLITAHGSSAVEEREPNGLPPIMRAIFEGQLAALKFLIDSGADVTARDPESWSSLHVAAAMDDFESAEMILSAAGERQDMTCSRNVDEERPIDLADSIKMARLLLHADLAASHIQQACATAESEGIISSEREVLQLVKDHFEKHADCKGLDDVLHENTCYSSLLHLAACKNYPHLVDHVCKHRLSSLETRDKNGWTPLHNAAYYNSLDVVLLLVEGGANIHALTHSFEKALDLTDHELIQALLEKNPTYMNSI